MKKAKKGSSEVLTKTITLKISENINEQIIAISKEKGVSKTEFMRDAIQTKVDVKSIADELKKVISEGISKVEDAARSPIIINNILTNIEILNALVAASATKADLDEHNLQVEKTITAGFKHMLEGFSTLSNTYLKLVGHIQESHDSFKKKLDSLDYLLSKTMNQYQKNKEEKRNNDEKLRDHILERRSRNEGGTLRSTD